MVLFLPAWFDIRSTQAVAHVLRVMTISNRKFDECKIAIYRPGIKRKLGNGSSLSARNMTRPRVNAPIAVESSLM